MKKILVTLLFVSTAAIINAQEFKIGLGGGIYSTWLVNKNVSDQGPDVDFASTFGGQVGLNLQYYFKDNFGINMGLLITGHNQKYTGKFDNGDKYESKANIRYLDVPVLLRAGGGAKGAYFEFGPQFSFLMTGKEAFTSTPANSVSNDLLGKNDYKDFNIKDDLKSSVISGVIGFGVDIDASEDIIIVTGLRLGYSFTDVTKEYTEAEALALYLTDKLSYLSVISHTDRDSKFDYHANNRAFGGLFLSVIYKISSGK